MSNTMTVESQPRNNAVALSTPAELDVVQLVKDVASRKFHGAENAHSYVTRKGKTDLFSGVWAAYRSAKGIMKFDEQLKPTQATAAQAAEINEAINAFWLSVNRDFMAFGEMKSSKRGGINGKLNGEGDADLYQTWTMTRKQDAQGLKERLFFAQQMKHKASKRFDAMRENVNGKFDRSQIAEQNKVLCLWEAEVSKLEKMVAK